MNITKKQLTKKVRENCMVTPAGWGNTCIIFDEVLACESMVECDWDTYEYEDDNGNIVLEKMTAEDFKNQLDKEKTDKCDIYDVDGHFYAVVVGGVNDGLACRCCDDPSEEKDGMVSTFGGFNSVDDDDEDE